jgi:hypothetical protein
MSDELVQFNGGRLVFSEAVGRVAEALHPLGPAARMVAETCALGIELKRLSNEGKQLEADRIRGLAELAGRRTDADSSFDLMRDKAARHKEYADGINESLRELRKTFTDPRTSLAVKQMCMQMMTTFAREANNRAASDGDDITEGIDSILNGKRSRPASGGNRSSKR